PPEPRKIQEDRPDPAVHCRDLGTPEGQVTAPAVDEHDGGSARAQALEVNSGSVVEGESGRGAVERGALGPQTGPRQGEEQGTRCQPGGTVCRARKRRPFGAHVCLLDGSSIACTEPSGGPAPCSPSPAHYLVMNKGPVL